MQWPASSRLSASLREDEDFNLLVKDACERIDWVLNDVLAARSSEAEQRPWEGRASVMEHPEQTAWRQPTFAPPLRPLPTRPGDQLAQHLRQLPKINFDCSDDFPATHLEKASHFDQLYRPPPPSPPQTPRSSTASERLIALRPPQEILHQIICRHRPARLQHRLPVPHRRRAIQQIPLIELVEEVQRNHLAQRVRVVV